MQWQISLGTSEATSLDVASVPEKEIQCPHICVRKEKYEIFGSFVYEIIGTRFIA